MGSQPSVKVPPPRVVGVSLPSWRHLETCPAGQGWLSRCLKTRPRAQVGGASGGRGGAPKTQEAVTLSLAPGSHPNVNLSTLLSTSVDWSSWASAWRMDTRTPVTVA